MHGNEKLTAVAADGKSVCAASKNRLFDMSLLEWETLT